MIKTGLWLFMEFWTLNWLLHKCALSPYQIYGERVHKVTILSQFYKAYKQKSWQKQNHFLENGEAYQWKLPKFPFVATGAHNFCCCC